MKTLHVALALGLFSLVACGDDSETGTSGGGGSTSGTGGADAGTGGEASTPSSSASSSPTSSNSSSQSTASGEGGTGDGGSGGTGAGDTGGGTPVGAYCTPRAADRDRFVVVGHPYDDNADPGNDWEVLALSSAGALTTTGQHFQMGRASDTPIAFAANGEIGLAVQDDGTLGVFSLDGDGVPTVIDGAWGTDEFYLNSIALAPEGDHFIAANVNWPDSGGGLYRIDIDCETGELSTPTLVIETKNAWAIASLGDGRWAIGGTGADGVEGGDDVHVLVEDDPWSRQSGASAFEEDPATPQALGAARDGSFVVVGNYSLFGTNEVALVGTDPSGAEVLGDALEFPTPYGVAVSPAGDVAIVTSAEEDQIGIFDIDPDAAEPFTLRGTVDAQSSPVLLPGSVTTVQAGPLDGLALVVELQGVRVLRFEAGGEVSEDFLLLGAEDDDFVTIPYGIGVQP